MIHEQLDIEPWLREFDVNALREHNRAWLEAERIASPHQFPDEREFNRRLACLGPHKEVVVQPHQLAMSLQLRKERLAGLETKAVPAHVFVWKGGEAPAPRITRRGGLPLMPRGMAWPVSPENRRPLEFVAQLSFFDSAHLVGVDLPGDLLLFFADVYKGEYVGWPIEAVWVDSAEARLAATEDLPVPVTVATAYGVLCETHDLVGSFEDDENDEEDAEQLGVLEGTKVGGVPYWIQDDESPAGQFVGTLGSCVADRRPGEETLTSFGRMRWPYLKPGHAFSIGDMGSLHAFVTPWKVDGVPETRIVGSCY